MRSVALQSISKPEIYHGAGIKLRADARIRVQEAAGFVISAGAKAKSVTNPLIIPSVLCVRALFKSINIIFFLIQFLMIINQGNILN